MAPLAPAPAVEHEIDLSRPADDRAPRVRSFDPDDFPVPQGREEEWRFTPLERLRGLHDGTAVPTGPLHVTAENVPGVTVELVGRSDPRLGAAYTPTDRVAATAWARFDTAVVLDVASGVDATQPCTVTFSGSGQVAYGHVLIRLGAQARATVVLEHSGTAVYAGNVEVDLGAGADLTLVSVQAWDTTAVHVGQQHARLGRDARLRSSVVTLGGGVVRLSPSVEYTGPGADAELVGAFVAGPGQHLEHRIFIEHTAAHCRSDVRYKGALSGQGAHTVWIGDVLIRSTAVGTDTYELNRNLVLSGGARADSVPNLEIETGEIVGAGHASATGRFDDEQLFYLQSRGLPAEVARRLVVHGFFAELLALIGVPGLDERLVTAIDARLGTAPRDDGGVR